MTKEIMVGLGIAINVGIVFAYYVKQRFQSHI